MLKLTNTLTRKTETFKTLKRSRVSLYTCGPTVYDHPHIGNWRTFIFYDTLSRTLRANGLKVNHVLNITDVGHLTDDADSGEDKLVAASIRERKTAWEIAREYTREFIDGMADLNFTMPEKLPKATDHIKDQIDFIKQLEKSGYTYRIDDGVYFDISRFKDYGKLARLDSEGMLAGARVEVNRQKRHPADFALWKFTPRGVKRDMEWDSPWGRGFPGWHLECSVMAMKYLGKTIDIHAGGVDHIPIHHTNEIAQSEAATGLPLANYWLHSEFMTVEGEKMAKSKRNFYTLADLKRKGFEPLAFRTLILQSHYRTQINFTWDALQAARTFLQSTLRPLADLALQPHVSGQELPYAEKIKAKLIEAVSNDLNTAVALSVLAKLADSSSVLSKKGCWQLHQILALADDLLGLRLAEREGLKPELQKLIDQRTLVKTNHDYGAADKIRTELKEQGVGLRDADSATTWYRTDR